MPAVFLMLSIMGQGLLAAALGLAGVFAVLIVFYICTKIMLTISIRSNKKQMAKEAANTNS